MLLKVICISNREFMLIKLERKFIITCPCQQKFYGVSEDDILERVKDHILRNHYEEYVQLSNSARILARSQNGAGYFDCDTFSKTDEMLQGWWASQETFRNAWIKEALKRLINQGK